MPVTCPLLVHARSIHWQCKDAHTHEQHVMKQRIAVIVQRVTARLFLLDAKTHALRAWHVRRIVLSAWSCLWCPALNKSMLVCFKCGLHPHCAPSKDFLVYFGKMIDFALPRTHKTFQELVRSGHCGISIHGHLLLPTRCNYWRTLLQVLNTLPTPVSL